MLAEARGAVSAPGCPVALVGGAARQALASGSGWTVFAAFRRSFYCRSVEGSLVCLGPPSIGGGPLNVVCAVPAAVSWEAVDLQPGAPVEWDGQALRVDGRFILSLAAVRDWRPAPMPSGWNVDVLARGLAALASEARARVLTDGLGPLIPMVTDVVGGSTPPPAGTLVLRTAWGGIVALAGWLSAALSGEGCPTSSPPPSAEMLIGLGPGLTPSGDDFLGGILIGLHALGQPAIADSLAAWALPVARARTHAISVAHLACAATGEGMAPLHQTLAALCSPGTPGLRACLDSLEAIGHTSGWDALAGVSVISGVVLGKARDCL